MTSQSTSTHANYLGISLHVLLLGMSVPAETQPRQISLPETKIAYLANFARYIRWPQSSFEAPDSPIIIAISKDHPYAQQLDETVAGRSKTGRNIIFRTFDELSDLAHKHLVYLEETDQAPLEFLQDSSSPTVTVTDTAEYAQGASLIQLVERNKRVFFYIDEEKAGKLGLKIHYKVLMMARNSRTANE